jgi:hypothetical protein
LSDPERSTLAEIAKRLGRKALRDIARVATPDTILGWYCRLVAHKFEVLAGADFFTVEVLTWRGLVTYYVLFFIEVGSRRVSVGASPAIRTHCGWSRLRATRRCRTQDI